jgi:hypothetical protein
LIDILPIAPTTPEGSAERRVGVDASVCRPEDTLAGISGR